MSLPVIRNRVLCIIFWACCFLVSSQALAAEAIQVKLVGVSDPLEIAPGKSVVPINFDNAATTPPFVSVLQAVEREARMYGSIGRGKGQKSEHSTKVYEDTRAEVLRFFNAPGDTYMAVYISSATEGLNKLAQSLLQDTDIVLTSRMEHHANDLPWRKNNRVLFADVLADGRLDFADFEKKLKENSGKIKLVSLTAASNMTGYINDVRRAARLAHQHGALIAVDGAQIAAHRKFSLSGATPEEDVDFFVFSAHKMYAPFGGGALIARRDIMEKLPPAFTGGGIVDIVTDDKVKYLSGEARFETGSPNYFGVVALRAAIREFEAVGFEAIVRHEQALLAKMIAGLQSIKGVTLHADNERIHDRVGIVIFTVDGMSDADVARELANRRGIAVRQGAFCAHPYAARILHVSNEAMNRELEKPAAHVPGMVRVSFGIYNTDAEVDDFLQTLRQIAADKKAAPAGS